MEILAVLEMDLSLLVVRTALSIDFALLSAHAAPSIHFALQNTRGERLVSKDRGERVYRSETWLYNTPSFATSFISLGRSFLPSDMFFYVPFTLSDFCSSVSYKKIVSKGRAELFA